MELFGCSGVQKSKGEEKNLAKKKKKVPLLFQTSKVFIRKIYHLHTKKHNWIPAQVQHKGQTQTRPRTPASHVWSFSLDSCSHVSGPFCQHLPGHTLTVDKMLSQGSLRPSY